MIEYGFCRLMVGVSSSAVQDSAIREWFNESSIRSRFSKSIQRLGPTWPLFPSVVHYLDSVRSSPATRLAIQLEVSPWRPPAAPCITQHFHLWLHDWCGLVYVIIDKNSSKVLLNQFSCICKSIQLIHLNDSIVLTDSFVNHPPLVRTMLLLLYKRTVNFKSSLSSLDLAVVITKFYCCGVGHHP